MADAPSAPSWRGKRGEQVRRWLERRGRRAVRPQARHGSSISPLPAPDPFRNANHVSTEGDSRSMVTNALSDSVKL